MSIGQTISGRYEIFRELGRGGMGEVFAATDLQLERKVALKAIRSEFRLDPMSRARFLREARALSKLEHESICRIYDYVEDTDQDYLVLELIEGVSLRERLRSGIDNAAAFRIAEQTADALGVAHAEGLIHRDLKPGNVMITTQGDAKILDFGLARTAIELESVDRGSEPSGNNPDLTTTDAGFGEDGLEQTMTSVDPLATATSYDSVTMIGKAVGTPLYMSPEQARGEELSSASDMFSFGLLLQEMFTGSRAYFGPPSVELTGAIVTGRPARVRGVDRHLADLIERLESPAPSRRPSALDATARLRWIRTKPQRRLRWGAAALLVVAAIGAGIKYTLDLRREHAAAEFRRNQSDEHIEFMVEELYKRLEPVGRLDILEDVGNKALAYFETLSDEETTSDDRARLARTLTQVGHVRLSLGDLERAGESFERSMSIHAELVAENPASSEWLIGLSGAHFGAGNTAWLNDDLEQMRKHFEIYLEISNDLMELDPDNPVHQLELAYALTNMAALHEASRDFEQAIGELERAIVLKRQLLDGEPENREYVRSLANTLGWLARVCDENGDTEAGLEYIKRDVALRRTLAEDTRDTDAQRNLATSLHEFGVVLSKLGLDDDAEAALREDLTIARRLAQLDPGNNDWRRSAASSSRSLGRLLLENGRTDEARPLLEESYKETRAILALVGDAQPDWHEDHEGARNQLALLEFTVGSHREALRILDEGPRSVKPTRHVPDLLLRGRIRKAMGDLAGAERSWRTARQVLDTVPPDDRSRTIERLSTQLADLTGEPSTPI